MDKEIEVTTNSCFAIPLIRRLLLHRLLRPLFGWTNKHTNIRSFDRRRIGTDQYHSIEAISRILLIPLITPLFSWTSAPPLRSIIDLILLTRY